MVEKNTQDTSARYKICFEEVVRETNEKLARQLLGSYQLCTEKTVCRALSPIAILKIVQLDFGF